MRRRAGVVEVVTGGGKTAFALMCYKRLVEAMPDLRLLVVVPTIALLDQWAVTLELDLGVTQGDIATHGGGRNAATGARVHVAVLNTARSLTMRLTRVGKWMLVVDECHRAGSPENARALEGTYVAALGLSATPERQFDNAFADVVSPRLGGVIFRYTHGDARRDGVISQFDLDNVEFALTGTERARYDLLTRRIAQLMQIESATHAPSERLKALLRRRVRVSNDAHQRIPAALACLQRYPGKAIVFHESIRAVEAITEAANKSDRRVGCYHSRLGDMTRRQVLRQFRENTLDTLVTCRALDEGLNVPDASLAIIAASTSSHRQRIQRLGRVLRASSPTKRATVVTLFATDTERRRLVEEEARVADVADIRWLKTRVTA